MQQTDHPGRYWVLIIVLLLVAIIGAGAITAGIRHGHSQPIDISTPPAAGPQGQVYVGGAVTSPGFYPLKSGDTVASLIEGAGGTLAGADLTSVRVYVSEAAGPQEPQRIDLNRAEAWLLEALPGIGETRARAIIDYRNQHGGFRNINDLLLVKGLSSEIIEKIRPLVTVAD